MKKKLLTLTMVGILSLSAIGFGYAKWSDTVDAKVTVNTGDVKIGIRDVGTNDDDGNPLGAVADVARLIDANPIDDSGADPQWGIGNNSEKKDVATMKSVNGTTVVGTIDGVDYYDSISETITNAYPYYGPTTVFEIASLGSVPVKLENLTSSWETTGPLDDGHFQIRDWTITKPDSSTISSTATTATREGLINALKGIQLHKNQVVKVSVQTGVTQNDPEGNITAQNESGTFNIHIDAAQWNEVTTPTNN